MRPDDFVMLFDEHGNPTQPRPLEQALQMHLQDQMRLVQLFIKNSKQQLWVGTRCTDSWLYPHAQQIGSFTYVGVDETHLQALQRQVFDDLGIDLSACKPKLRDDVVGVAPQLAPAKVYELEVDVEQFDCDPLQFQKQHWQSIAQLAQLQKSKERCVPESTLLFYNQYMRS